MIETRAMLEHFGSIGALLLAGAFIFHLMHKMRNAGKVDSVNAGLYEQLQQQLGDARAEIARLTEKISKVYDERNASREELASLSHRVQQLEECEKTVDILKERLAQKDALIHERDIENKQLMHEILQLKDRIHHLELRLAQDEERFCKECQHRQV